MKNVEQTAFALLQAEKRRKELEIETLLADLRKDPAFAAAEISAKTPHLRRQKAKNCSLLFKRHV